MSNQIKLQGIYTFSKFRTDKNGKEIPETRKSTKPFKNLILDTGLDALGSSSITSLLTRCYVGGGGSTPAASQSSLDAPIAETFSIIENASVQETSDAPFYVGTVRTYRFNQGEAQGNLTEVGVGDLSTLFSRALILDSNGDPTTFTVLEDEVLDVTYELRLIVDATPVEGVISINIDGTPTDYNYSVIPSTLSASSWAFSNGFGSSGASPVAYSGEPGSATGVPSGSQASGSGSTPVVENQQSTRSVTFGLTQGNVPGGIRTIRLGIGVTIWQIRFGSVANDDPIPKTDTQSFTINFTAGWSR